MYHSVFALVKIGAHFQFLGNPIIWEKTSDFTAKGWDVPYPIYDEDYPVRSVLSGAFHTDSMVKVGGKDSLII